MSRGWIGRLTDHQTGFRERVGVLQRVDARNDLPVAEQTAGEEVEGIRSVPDIGTRAGQRVAAGRECYVAGDSDVADVLISERLTARRPYR